MIVPTSSGGNIRGIEKGFHELKACGLPGASPIDRGTGFGMLPYTPALFFKRQSDRKVYPRTHNCTRNRKSLPPSGNVVLRMLKENQGITVAVNEDEILTAQRQLAKRGLFGQPAKAVAFGFDFKAEKAIDVKRAIVVAVLTGSGLK